MPERRLNALLSVYDKTGIVELARALHDLGVNLVSSGGTASTIASAGIPVTDTAELTGSPAILGHRVVTLHPKVHGGILADPTDPSHRADMDEHGIEAFDLVVVNAYPFGSDPADFEHGGSAGSAGGGATAMDVLDIGGPAMIRAAAKNHAHVGIVTDPADYDEVLTELRTDRRLSDDLRRRLARKAFAFTAAYDAGIVAWFDEQEGEPRPETLHLSYRREPVALRYGENPHQSAALYRAAAADPWWAHVEVHGGLALSYLNLFDADAAWLLAHDLRAATGQPAVAIIKHANPCGAAVAPSLADAYQRAFDCDPRSAFGGIVALSDRVDAATVEAMVAAAQADLVIAPDYADGAIEALLAKRKNTRVLRAPAPVPDARHLRPITGGMLVQDPHRFLATRADWRVVTTRQPTEAEWADAELAWRVCGHVKSNAIVLTKDGVAWGIGAGQQNRVESGEIAAKKADGRAAGGACASDAFYPFPDGIEAAAAAGVAVIVQPGGSVKDEATIARADELGVAMVFTGERHFLH
ncbi:MAG TPA: bifunctional phosphoribosylaminoimidazolecarboxamide formyltransferase/IMP cyclohydrolase [Acidimicrobiales bacterium]|nr:bifunctional phosphoribosylaminoimidazolecarboxamide formyltransferase/IMP cyclohydrolase [Acidimicrobiales bacterium]